LITYSQAATAPKTFSPGATANSRCNEVSPTALPASNTQCASCFGWNTDPRAQNVSATSNNCITKLTNTIAECETYIGFLYNTNTTSYPGNGTCFICKKSYYNWAHTTVAGLVTAACSSSKGTGCTGTIDNAVQTVCVNNIDTLTNGTFSSQFAHACNKGYLPVENDIWDQGCLKCVSGTVNVPNCRWLGNGGSQFTAASCFGCNKNFGLNGSSQCVGYTTDENCRGVNTQDEGCIKCWYAYYFSGTTCTLYSQLLLLQFISLFGLLAFFY